MRPILTVLPALALVAAGCGAAKSATTTTPAAKNAAAPASTVTVATRHTKLGTVLVDGEGRTLYLFEKDKGAASTCDGDCANAWPPVIASKAAAGGAAKDARLGTFKRADGMTAIDYAGHPLYTYAGDTKPGDVNGQDLDQFGAKWYVLAPDGRKVDDD